jgi:hypothetical protein
MEKKRFQKLKKTWYDKIAKDGFTDIENIDGSLKTEVHPRTFAAVMKTKQSTLDYYEGATRFLNTHFFSSSENRKIWEMHCEGMGAVRISKKLHIPKSRVHNILFEYKHLAGIERKK